jgi:hypothetical protein
MIKNSNAPRKPLRETSKSCPCRLKKPEFESESAHTLSQNAKLSGENDLHRLEKPSLSLRADNRLQKTDSPCHFALVIFL